jgi:hypothetical protein
VREERIKGDELWLQEEALAVVIKRAVASVESQWIGFVSRELSNLTKASTQREGEHQEEDQEGGTSLSSSSRVSSGPSSSHTRGGSSGRDTSRLYQNSCQGCQRKPLPSNTRRQCGGSRRSGRGSRRAAGALAPTLAVAGGGGRRQPQHSDERDS